MVDSAFQKLKSNLELNESFGKLIQQKHNAVRSVIENINPAIKTKLIGSLQRKTRIQPVEKEEFDIDILVILGEFSRWVSLGSGVTPSDALQKVHDSIGESDRYDAMGPEKDAPVVTFEYKDGIKVELVPAYVDNIGHWPDGTPTVKGRGYWVPKNGRWELADYDHEAEHLTSMNTVSDGFLVPTIKMLKALKREYFPALGSFHLEILSAQTVPRMVLAHKQREIPVSYPVLIKNFFLLAKDSLGQPVKIQNSNSPEIILSSADLEKIQNAFHVIHQYCESIEMQENDQKKVEMWRELFGSLIPQN